MYLTNQNHMRYLIAKNIKQLQNQYILQYLKHHEKQTEQKEQEILQRIKKNITTNQLIVIKVDKGNTLEHMKQTMSTK
jgi:hypoxanthine-guanine phosphoribosyltransferase